MSHPKTDGYHSKSVPFCKTTLTCTNYLHSLDYEQKSSDLDANNTKRVIFCGGSREEETAFQYLVVETRSQHDSWKIESMNAIDGKKNADLKFYGRDNGENIHTFITSDRKNIILIHCGEGYNVYNAESDSWLLKENIIRYPSQNRIKWPSGDARCLWINDELIITSHRTSIIFFDLSDILTPKQIVNYEIKSQIQLLLNNRKAPKSREEGYSFHGMCLIDMAMGSQLISNDNYSYSASFVLFGANMDHRNIRQNVIKVNFEVKVKINDNNTKHVVIENIKDMVIQDAPRKDFPPIGGFAYLSKCISNSNGQKLIVMFHRHALYLYNFDENRITKQEKVT